MKIFVFALLIGVSTTVMAASVSEGGIKIPTIERADVTKRSVLVDDFDTDDVTTPDDLKDLKRYEDIGRDDNIEAALRLQKRMQVDPEKLMVDLDSMSPNLNVALKNGKMQQKKVEVSEQKLEEIYQQALKQLEDRSHQKLDVQQQAPVMMVPTVEEVKKLKIDRYLPEGWEELLANSKEYREALRKRKTSGKKMDLTDPNGVDNFVKFVHSNQSKK